MLFVELEMKSQAGFYSGQVEDAAFSKDEEVHKSIVLRDVYFKPRLTAAWKSLDDDLVMIDLADAVRVSVRQVAEGVAP